MISDSGVIPVIRVFAERRGRCGRSAVWRVFAQGAGQGGGRWCPGAAGVIADAFAGAQRC